MYSKYTIAQCALPREKMAAGAALKLAFPGPSPSTIDKKKQRSKP